MIDRCATLCGGRSRPNRALYWIAAMVVLLTAGPTRADDERRPRAADSTAPAAARSQSLTPRPASTQTTAEVSILDRVGVPRSLQTIVLFGAALAGPGRPAHGHRLRPDQHRPDAAAPGPRAVPRFPATRSSRRWPCC